MLSHYVEAGILNEALANKWHLSNWYAVKQSERLHTSSVALRFCTMVVSVVGLIILLAFGITNLVVIISFFIFLFTGLIIGFVLRAQYRKTNRADERIQQDALELHKLTNDSFLGKKTIAEACKLIRSQLVEIAAVIAFNALAMDNRNLSREERISAGLKWQEFNSKFLKLHKAAELFYLSDETDLKAIMLEGRQRFGAATSEDEPIVWTSTLPVLARHCSRCGQIINTKAPPAVTTPVEIEKEEVRTGSDVWA